MLGGVPGQPSQAVECGVENQKSRAGFNNLRVDLQKVTFQKTMYYPPHAHMSRGYKANWFAKGGSSTEVVIRNQMPSLGIYHRRAASSLASPAQRKDVFKN